MRYCDVIDEGLLRKMSFVVKSKIAAECRYSCFSRQRTSSKFFLMSSIMPLLSQCFNTPCIDSVFRGIVLSACSFLINAKAINSSANVRCLMARHIHSND